MTSKMMVGYNLKFSVGAFLSLAIKVYWTKVSLIRLKDLELILAFFERNFGLILTITI